MARNTTITNRMMAISPFNHLGRLREFVNERRQAPQRLRRINSRNFSVLRHTLFQQQHNRQIVHFRQTFQRIIRTLLGGTRALTRLFRFGRCTNMTIEGTAARQSFGIRIFVTEVEAHLARIRISPNDARTHTDNTPLRHLFHTVNNGTLKAAFRGNILRHHFLMEHRAFQRPIRRLARRTVPTTQRIIHCTTGARPHQIRARADSYFRRVMGFLAVNGNRRR